MEAILYTNVVCENVNEVDRILRISSLTEKVKMLKYVCHSNRIYFSISSKRLPSVEVTSLILQNIVNSKVYWSEALHIAVRYRNYGIVRTLISESGVDTTISLAYTSSNILVEATPIEMSIYNGDTRMIALLLAHNIPICPPYRRTRLRFHDTDPIETIKLQSAMDNDDFYFSEKHDLVHAAGRGMYDRMLVFMATPLSNLLVPMYVGDAICSGNRSLVRLLHTHFKKTEYGETVSLDLPSLQEVSLYTLRISLIREELAAIRDALRSLKENETWMEIENDRILYPLIGKVIESFSTTDNCRVLHFPPKDQINR